MNTLLKTVGVVVVIGMLIWVVFLVFQKPTQTKLPVAHPTLPVASSTDMGAGQPVPDQSAAAGTQPEIAHAFLSQTHNPSNYYVPKETVVVSGYALQHWGTSDGNGGGQALLKYTASGGWQLIQSGGGSFDVPTLVANGVPQPIAAKLLVGVSP